MANYTCSQCDTVLKDGIYSGDSIYDAPVCIRCAEVLNSAQDAMISNPPDEDFRCLSIFKEEQAKQILKIAGQKVEAWRENNPGWYESLYRKSMMYWAKQIYGVEPLQPFTKG